MFGLSKTNPARIEDLADDDHNRVTNLLSSIGGASVVWGAADVLNVWLAESRMEAERQASQRLLVASWVLAAATIALVLATVGLIVATVW